MEETESFGREFGVDAGQAGQVAAWSANTGNKTVLHWITASVEHDWYRRSGSLGSLNCPIRLSREYHRHLSTDEVRDEWQLLVLRACPAEFNRNVPANNEASLHQTLLEGSDPFAAFLMIAAPQGSELALFTTAIDTMLHGHHAARAR